MDLPPSSSVSSSSTDNSHFENCQICSKPAHGKHFGAYSCRACAAFFRRAIIGKYQDSVCRRSDDKCEEREIQRPYCRKCRLTKCQDAGMKEDKLQFDRDLVSSTTQPRKTTMKKIPLYSLENFIGRPSFIFSCEPDRATSNRTIIDVQYLIDHAVLFFISNTGLRRDKVLNSMSTLDRLSYALNLSRIPSKETPTIINKIGKNEYLMFYEYKFLSVGNWLTYCDEFQKQPHALKIELLKAIWFIYMKIEKMGKEAEKQMKKQEDERNTIMHLMKNMYVDMNKIDLDTSWMSNYTPEQLHYYFDSSCRLQQDTIVNPLLDLQATSNEITYIICVICFRYAARQNPGDIAELSEKLIDKLADDLHNYYINEMNLAHYAPRLAKLMKIVQFVEIDIYERRKRAEIAKVFDIFTIEFSHPEMFIGIV